MTAPDDTMHVDPTRRGAPEPPRPERRTRSPFGGCLRAIAVLGLCFVAVVLVAFIALFLQLREMGRTPDPIKAPVTWTTHEVVLSSSEPIVHGRLSIRSGETSGRSLTLGLNAGAPATPALSSSPTTHVAGPSRPTASFAELGQALQERPVRLTATDAQGVVHRCAAPCELTLAAFDCRTGSCAATFDLTIELLGNGPANGGPVTVAISGGGSGSLGDSLPPQFAVDLALDAPSASGEP